MEPGHEDREEIPALTPANVARAMPQWSPVTRTGKSCGVSRRPSSRSGGRNGARSRGPGREESGSPMPSPSMIKVRRNGARSRGPGRATSAASSPATAPSRNGARSRGPGRGWVGTTPRGRRWTSRNGARSRGPGRGGRRRPPGAAAAAAMEPGHEDREDTGAGHRTWPAWSRRNGARSRGPGRAARAGVSGGLGPVAAMEPGHEDREELTAVGHQASALRMPQWSPVTRTGKRASTRSTTGSSRTCRNGARSRGPGRGRRHHPRHPPRRVAAMEPGHEDREEALPARRLLTGSRAAMEPGHEDREEPRWPARYSWRFRGRNGARSRGPGRAGTDMSGATSAGGRNGARSRGPGRGVQEDRPGGEPQIAAMEPGHEDREEEEIRALMARYKVPQWSPVTRTGKRGVQKEASTDMNQPPQWSPVTRTGKRARLNHSF